MSGATVLYDGWTLCRDPLGPPALHLLDLLENRPEGVAAHLAVPELPPDWLPQDLTIIRFNTRDTPAARLLWEQRTLPKLAVDLAAALHLTTASAPLFGSAAVFVSPAGSSQNRQEGGWLSRLRTALGRGGSARARLVWPDGVPPPAETAGPHLLPAALDSRYRPHSAFLPPQIDEAPELPPTYFLVHMQPDRAAIRTALEAWTWAAGPIGEVYPLLFLGLPQAMQEHARSLGRTLGVSDTLHFYPAIRPTDMHILYQAASAVFLPQPAGPWSSPLHLALACGIPAVALETAVSSAIAGPAAYLVPGEDTRALGAALISVIVKDDLRSRLADAGLGRVEDWSMSALWDGLARVYAQPDRL